MTDHARTGWAATGWIVALLTVACYLRIGYGYGTGDHEEILPQLLRALDPTLFPRDPYLLGEDDAFSVRFVFLGLLRGASLVRSPPVAVFALTVASWAGVSWAGLRLADALGADRRAGALAVLLAVATVHWTPGGNAIISRTLVPESLAWTPVLLAVAAFARGAPYRAAAWLGAAAWLQPLIGLQFGLLLGLVGLWRMADGDPARAFRQSAGFGALFFSVASPILVPTLLTQAGTAPPDDGLTTFYVTAWLRQAHHYLLLSQHPADLLRFGAIVLAGLAAGLFLHRRHPARDDASPGGRADRFTTRALAVTAALVALYVVGTEGLESLTVAKMQFFRLTVLAKLLLLVWLARAAVARAHGWLPGPAEAWGMPPARVGWAVAVAVVVGTVALGLAGVGRPASVWRPAQHRATDVYRAERWIAQNTPRDAVFLVPPGTTSFRSHALRSVAVNFKPTTFRDDAMHVWLHRLRTVAPAPLPPRSGGRAAIRQWRESLDPAYHAHTAAEWAALARTFGADFALVDLGQTPTPPAGTPVYRSGPWAVFRL